MSAPHSRPRVVTVAFWCWLVAAVLLVTFGLLLVFNTANLPVFLRGAGALLSAAGLALGYFAGQTRAGHRRLRRAAVGLSMALVFILALFILLGGGILWTLPMILTMVAGILMLRPAAQEWHPVEKNA
jgi:hypothetical protein